MSADLNRSSSVNPGGAPRTGTVTLSAASSQSLSTMCQCARDSSLTRPGRGELQLGSTWLQVQVGSSPGS
eukprot:2538701-Rhodomonas_salina.1